MTPQEQEGYIPSLEIECGGPCPPGDACPCCEGYWERMKAEGFWDGQRAQWTEKGWNEIVRHA